MAPRRVARRQRLTLIVFLCIACLVWFFYFHSSGLGQGRSSYRPREGDGSDERIPGPDDTEMVVASMKKENLTWLDDYLLDWKKNIYVVDDPYAPLTVPVNKGREAMVFLTYVTSPIPDFFPSVCNEMLWLANLSVSSCTDT